MQSQTRLLRARAGSCQFMLLPVLASLLLLRAPAPTCGLQRGTVRLSNLCMFLDACVDASAADTVPSGSGGTLAVLID